MQLLEAIGAISKADAQKATSRNGNYQDSTTAPLSHAHNDEAAGQDDGDQLDEVNLIPDASSKILPAVDKVSHLIYPFASKLLTSSATQNHSGHSIQSQVQTGLV